MSLDREALLALISHQKMRNDSKAICSSCATTKRSGVSSKRNLIPSVSSLSEQAEELRHRSERIEHLKLMVEKFRHMIFGRKSEKIVAQARADGV